MKSKMEQVADQIGHALERQTLDAQFQVFKAGCRPLAPDAPVLRTAEEIAELADREQKLQAKHAAKQAWIRFILCVAPANRLQAFLQVHSHLSDHAYWRVLRHVWNKRLNRSCGAVENTVWRLLYVNPRADREAFMLTPDRITYRNLPDEIKAYRGYGAENREGFYYSLNPHVAMHFAAKRGGDFEIKTFPKRDCFYIGGDLEEIIYVPGMGDLD